MNRVPRILLVAILIGGFLSVGRLALPGAAFACMCAEFPNVRTFDGVDEGVLVGRVGDDNRSGQFPMTVERWFHGGDAAMVLLDSGTRRMPDGSYTSSSCGVQLNAGMHLVLAAPRAVDRLAPNTCTPLASVESPEGQAMLADAVGRFGPGLVPGEPPEVDEQLDVAFIAIVAALVVVLAIVGAVVVLAVGRREPPDTRQP